MEIPLPEGLSLFPYQAQDIEAWVALPRPRALWNCSEMGTGKTVDGVVCARVCNYDHILVVASKSTRPQWSATFAKWWPEREPAAEIDRGFTRKSMSGPERFRLQAILDNRTHICSPELLAKLVALHETGELAPYDYIVFDEFHEYRSYWSATFQAMLKLRRMYPQADLKPLSGTPMGSDPLGAWPWLKLSEPAKWGALRKGESAPFRFRQMWGIQQESDYAFSGFSYSGVNLERLPAFAALVKHLIRRRTTREIGLQLPPMRFEIHRYGVMEHPEEAAAQWARSAVQYEPVALFTHNIAWMDRLAGALSQLDTPFVRLFQEHSYVERVALVKQAFDVRGTVILATTGLVSTGVDYMADIHTWMLAQPSENQVEIQQLARRFVRISSKDHHPRIGYLLYREGDEFAAQKALSTKLLTDKGIVAQSEDSAALEQVLQGNAEETFLATLRKLGRELAAHNADDDGPGEEDSLTSDW